jgi:energy-converting hydrogenase Eha subunit G
MSAILTDPATIKIGLVVLGFLATGWTAGHVKFGGEA